MNQIAFGIMDSHLTVENALTAPELFSSYLAKSGRFSDSCSKLLQLNWVSLVAEEVRWLHQLELLSGLILSSHPSLCLALVSALLRSLLLPARTDSPAVISVGGHKFTSSNDLKHAVFDLLHKYPVGSRLSLEHESFLLSIFAHHPRSEEKLTNYSHLTITRHTTDATTTKCFSIVSTDGQNKEISYVKSIAGFLANLASVASSKHTERLHKAASAVMQQLVKVVSSRPLLQGPVVDEVGHLLQRRATSDQACFYKCVVELTTTLPGLSEALWEKLIEKLVEFDCGEEVAAVDALLSVILEHVTSRTSLSLFRTLLRCFEGYVLPTYESKHSQIVMLAFLEQACPQVQEEFVSALINSVYAHQQVAASAAYLTSFFLRFEAPVMPSAVLFLVNYSLAALHKRRLRENASNVAKYLFHLVHKRPMLLENKELVELLTKLAKHKHLKLTRQLSDHPLLTLLTVVEETRHDPLFMPFSQDVTGLQLSQSYLQAVPGDRTKRRRGFSFDGIAPEKRQRSDSLDESSLRQIEVSSIDTNSS